MEQKRREELMGMEEFLVRQFDKVKNVIEPESGNPLEANTELYRSTMEVAAKIIRARAKVADVLEHNKGFV